MVLIDKWSLLLVYSKNTFKYLWWNRVNVDYTIGCVRVFILEKQNKKYRTEYGWQTRGKEKKEEKNTIRWEKLSAWVNMTFYHMNRERASISLSNVCCSIPFVAMLCSHAGIVLSLNSTNEDEIVCSAPLNTGQCIVWIFVFIQQRKINVKINYNVLWHGVS